MLYKAADFTFESIKNRNLYGDFYFLIFIAKTGLEIHKNKIKAQGLFAATKL